MMPYANPYVKHTYVCSGVCAKPTQLIYKHVRYVCVRRVELRATMSDFISAPCRHTTACKLSATLLGAAPAPVAGDCLGNYLLHRNAGGNTGRSACVCMCVFVSVSVAHTRTHSLTQLADASLSSVALPPDTRGNIGAAHRVHRCGACGAQHADRPTDEHCGRVHVQRAFSASTATQHARV